MTREEAIQYAQERFSKGLHRLEMGYLNRGLYLITAKEFDFLQVALAAPREQESAKNAHYNCCKKGNSSWISVDDEKPKRRGRYFIAYKFDGSDMRFYGEAMWHDDIPDNGYVQGDHFSNEGVNGMYVTHWMNIPKLPEPPEVEG